MGVTGSKVAQRSKAGTQFFRDLCLMLALLCTAPQVYLAVGCKRESERRGWDVYIRKMNPQAVAGKSPNEIHSEIEELVNRLLASYCGDAWRLCHVKIWGEEVTNGTGSGEGEVVYRLRLDIGQYSGPPPDPSEVDRMLDEHLIPDYVLPVTQEQD